MVLTFWMAWKLDMAWKCEMVLKLSMVWKFAIFVTKNTMSIPTIQTQCTEFAIFVTKNKMSIPTIYKTMHGIDILNGMEIGHGMEM